MYIKVYVNITWLYILYYDHDVIFIILQFHANYLILGVSLGDALNQPMHPKKLHTLIADNNKALFDVFLDFPKVSFPPMTRAPNFKHSFSYIFIHFHYSYIIVQLEMNEN